MFNLVLTIVKLTFYNSYKLWYFIEMLTIFHFPEKEIKIQTI